MSSFSGQWDLVIAVVLMLCISMLLFWGSRSATRRCPAWISGATAVLTLLATLGFVALLFGHLDVARLLPLPNVVVLGNWLPLCIAVLAGIVAGHPSIPKWRQTTIVGMLIGLASYTAAYDLFAASPRPGNPQFLNGACLQTTADSCSACCAATLLREYGIPASEREMMELCLTRYGGTPELGLFRGLKLKTQHSAWDIELLRNSIESLYQPEVYPVLLLIDVDSPNADEEQSWWRPRQAGHAVLATGITESGKIAISDPSSGPAVWTPSHLHERWYGDGLRLARRSDLGE